MDFAESSRMELKEVVNADFKKEIVAFANTDGGEIYVGVANDGTVVGVTDSEREMERISSMIHDGIHPDLVPFTSVEAVSFDEKKLIHVIVSRGGRPPYHLTDKGLKPSGVYVRHGVTSVPASEEMIREMIRQSDGGTYDKARSLNQELTFEYADAYFSDRKVAFQTENKRTLGLVDSDGFYTNAALLLSDQCEHSIKCAVFEGRGKTVFKARKEFFGSVLKQLEEAYEYISLNNNIHADFLGLERIESYDYPEYALREALINTVVHRDYDYSGSTIINIFSDRIEFVSIGGLVKGITLADILNGVSQSRNMALANIFYRLKLIESYGTGIQRILESYHGFLRPKFLPEAASFVTVLPNMNLNNEAEPYQNNLKDKNITIIKEPAYKYNTDLNHSYEEKVLCLLEEKGVITRRDVENLLGCSGFPARKVLNSLLSENKIIVAGNARATRYLLNRDNHTTN